MGGAETDVNEYPWIAVYNFGSTDGVGPGGCSSTLVANNWAVTAAHCFYGGTTTQTTTIDNMSVVLGVHDRTDPIASSESSRKNVKIAEIIIHESYNPSGSANDIALLKLAESIDLDTWSPACLPDQGADYTGKKGWVYGWGTTQESGNLADKLQELEVPIVNDDTCNTAMNPEGVTITTDMLCAGGVEGKDACGGDSGGPFTVEESGKHTLVGAVSFGIGCARAGLYGVYAEVAQFRTWIDGKIADKGGATFCS